MKTTKFPTWDKQEKENPIILCNPEDSSDDSLKICQVATCSIDNIPVAIQLTKIINSSDVEGEIIRIGQLNDEKDIFKELCRGDIVFLTLSDMVSLDTEVP